MVALRKGQQAELEVELLLAVTRMDSFVKFEGVTEDAGDTFRYWIYSLNLPNSKSVFKATWVTSQNN